MDYEIEYKKPEKKYLCRFTVDTRINDVDLPNKIMDKLSSLAVLPDSEKVYALNVSFGIVVYEDERFYDFPVERRQWQIDKLEDLKQKGDVKQLKHTIMGEVLAQQLHNICDALAPLNINYHSATIAGEDFEEINRVDFDIYEDTSAAREGLSATQKKEKRKETRMVSHSVVPHRPSLSKHIAEVLAKMILEDMQKKSRKEVEMSLHTLNLVSAEKMFTALATAILEDQPSEVASPEALSYELLNQAQIKDDWPLEIAGTPGVHVEENKLNPDSQIDCPEYLVYVKKKHSWTLRKVTDLAAAKRATLSAGYNLKSVQQVIVLHNLKNIRFNLFVDNDGEIAPISKSEAHTAKKLFLSWCESQY